MSHLAGGRGGIDNDLTRKTSIMEDTWHKLGGLTAGIVDRLQQRGDEQNNINDLFNVDTERERRRRQREEHVREIDDV